MVSTRFAALAMAAAVASIASAAHEGGDCYADGERAIGAPGYPAVDYMPCCSGKPPLPMAKDDYSYDDSMSWGLFCGGTGKVEVSEKCYKDGERAIGAKGYPAVDYMPCCNGMEPKSVSYDWGKFCVSGKPEPEVEEPKAKRCAGADGYPYVEYYDCGYGYKCVPAPKYGWGSFCVEVEKSDCYGPGERAIGEKGYPAIAYLPCCDYSAPVSMEYDWGKFCPGEYKSRAVTRAPVTKAPPVKKDPVYPVYPTKAPEPKCVKAGATCDPYGMKCCDDYECASAYYGAPYKCAKKMMATDAPTTTMAMETTTAAPVETTTAMDTTPMESDEA